MTWRYSREKTLLRVAPWLDADPLREKMIEAAKALFEKWGDRAPVQYQEQFDQFLAGERATFPNSYDFQLAFSKVFRNECRQHSTDSRWRDAKAELERYFFRQSYWMKE